jgi:hypothetical protein
MNLHIVDWTSKVMFDDKRFDSFEEARAFIDIKAVEYAPEIAIQLGVSIEEAEDGYCEDMYAEEVKDEKK